MFSGGEEEMCEFLGISKEQLIETYSKTDVIEYSINTISDYERWDLFVKELGVKSSKIEKLVNIYLNSYKPIQETVSFLWELKTEFPKFVLGVLSDQPASVVRLLREKYKDIFGLFKEDFTLISSELKISKRDPSQKLFKHALEKANVTNRQVLYIDDSITHLNNAAKAGIPGFHFAIKVNSPSVLIKKLKKKII